MIGMIVAGRAIAKLLTKASPRPDLVQASAKFWTVKLGSWKTFHQPSALASSLGRKEVITVPMIGTIQRKQMNQTTPLANGEAAPCPPPASLARFRENRRSPRPDAGTGVG